MRTSALACALCLWATTSSAQHIAQRAQSDKEMGLLFFTLGFLLMGGWAVMEAARAYQRSQETPIVHVQHPVAPSHPAKDAPIIDIVPDIIPESTTGPSDALTDPDQMTIRAHLTKHGLTECRVAITFVIEDTEQKISVPGIARLKPENGKIKFVYRGHERPWDQRKQLIAEQMKLSVE